MYSNNSRFIIRKPSLLYNTDTYRTQKITTMLSSFSNLKIRTVLYFVCKFTIVRVAKRSTDYKCYSKKNIVAFFKSTFCKWLPFKGHKCKNVNQLILLYNLIILDRFYSFSHKLWSRVPYHYVSVLSLWQH